MIPEPAPNLDTPITLPAIPSLAVTMKHACIFSADGEIQTINHNQARMILHKAQVLVCHAPFTRGRLGLEEFQAFDILELYTFVHPNQPIVPTVSGLNHALGLPAPEGLDDQAMALMDITRSLLTDLRRDPYKAKADPLEIASAMGMQGKGWPWTPFIFEALGQTYDPAPPINSRKAMNVWKHLPEWAEEAPEPSATHHSVSADEAKETLARLLGSDAEKRDQQMEYTAAMATSFDPPKDEASPPIVLAEAGTGVGKTLGYLAPASLWAEKNKGAVWISTYTKNLQRQIETELSRVYPDPTLKDTHVAVRKGRENYLCLLNLEETAAGAATAYHYSSAVAAGIMTRWAAATKDGDLSGTDFPGWLAGLLGYPKTLGLADRRGECLYSACEHYKKCFIERSVRKAKHARLVVANHALVMIQAAMAGADSDMPQRYIFDEGHHLFHAADSAFAAHLSGRESRDLRRWILGAEGGKRSRARGLKRRMEGVCEGDEHATTLMSNILHHATCLNAEGWTRRLKDAQPFGPCETFLQGVYNQVWARADGRDSPYSIETGVHPVEPDLQEQAKALHAALKDLQKPMQDLANTLRKKLAEDEGHMEGDMRRRMDALASSLESRAIMTLRAWMGMLETILNNNRHSVGEANASLKQTESSKDEAQSASTYGSPPSKLANAHRGDDNSAFVDWMEIERADGKAIDVGLYRHHTDPMAPFASAMRPHVQGMAITSATLRDTDNDGEEESWNRVIQRTGANALSPDVHTLSCPSPFDYAQQTKIIVINDVNKNDLTQVSGAYNALFQASGGGALGLFTAISRLRAVQQKIAPKLEEGGLNLYTQHVDEADAGTLVDMFREDTHACLLGTDAVRDGVDVPGESLRLIVFDRVPWPRPTILHKARREAFGSTNGNARQYDEMITRLKLKQAFGRLIRRAGDKGVFVMLDTGFPSRLHSAFPENVEVQKISLTEAVEQIKVFL